MVVVTISATLPSSLQSNNTQTSLYTISCKPSSPFLLHFRRLYAHPTSPNSYKLSNPNGVLSIRAYMENSNSFSGFANKIIGALPLVGLVARILSDEGGVGTDTIDFAEFRRRIGKKCTITDSRAFYELQDRRGRVIVENFELPTDYSAEYQV